MADLLTSLREYWPVHLLLAIYTGTLAYHAWNAGIAFPLLLGVLFAGTVKAIVEPRQLSRFYAEVIVSVAAYVFFSLVFRSHSGDEVERLFSEPTS